MSKQIVVVQRNAIPSVLSVVVDGVSRSLGVHKDFRRHPLIASFLPEHARLSVSWVQLREGEALSDHLHPTASMILICEGRGRVTGDHSADLAPGDVVMVPPGTRHTDSLEGRPMDSGHYRFNSSRLGCMRTSMPRALRSERRWHGDPFTLGIPARSLQFEAEPRPEPSLLEYSSAETGACWVHRIPLSGLGR